MNELHLDEQESVCVCATISTSLIRRFIEEYLKTVDTLIERIRLKTMTTKIQKRKAKQQLKHRQELGEALRAIDFEQLNIENQDCIRKIDEKTQHMLEIKKIAGNQ